MEILRIPLSFLLILGSFLAVHALPNEMSDEVELVIPDEEWVSCSYYKETLPLASCLCMVTEDEAHFKVNCDHVVFEGEFAALPYRQPIIYFSQRFANYQNIPSQAFMTSEIPIQHLDLSHNLLRGLPEKSLEGTSETLEIVDLSHNLLGDQLNPIFSTNEFKKLPRLRSLHLGHNLLLDIDGGILEGALSLQEVHLDNNLLRRVPRASLKGPNALRVLNLNKNRIDSLSSDDFSMQPSLVMLNISENAISLIQRNSFRSMFNLKMVDLSYNRLQLLDSDSFQGLSTIEALDLSYNYITEIPLTAIKSLTTLRGLRLSGNLIQTLKGADMKNFRNLEKIDLSRNRINEIPAGFFGQMSQLREINLGINQLRTVPAGIFSGLPHLERVTLSDNNLLTFPSAALDSIPSLTSLTLDYNRISALVPMKLHNLTKLSLANNLIREIPQDTLQENFPKLESLNLYGNLIEGHNLDEVIFPAQIKYLNLGLNNLKSVPRLQLPELETLKLQRNVLSTLLEHNFVLLGQLRELDLGSNNISTFYSNTFDGLSSLETLDLRGNSMDTLPEFGNLPFLRVLNFSKNKLKEIGSIQNMESLEVLDLSSNSISNIQPEIFSNTTNLMSINLSGNKLTTFKGFSGSFEKLRKLDLSKNQISYVFPLSFDNLMELWELNLSHNRFSFFPTEFLKNCKNLRALYFNSNEIKNLLEMNFSNFPALLKLNLNSNFIEFIPHNSFLNSSQLQFLSISSNKLESLDGAMFHGLIRLELDLSNNYLASLPPAIFEKMHVQRLQKINLSKNTFQSIPLALEKQYYSLEFLDMSDNSLVKIPPNQNILVNVKSLSLSGNKLDQEALRTVLNEPKTVRHLSLTHTGLKDLPTLEMPFLRTLNLSGNEIQGFKQSAFQRTTLLHTLVMDNNQISSLDTPFPASLTYLDLSSNPLETVNGHSFPESLNTLKLNHLKNVMKIEKASLNLKNLVTLELYDLEKLGYLDIHGLLKALPYLENYDFDVKDPSIVDQLHPGVNARVKNIGLRGKVIRSISTGAFAGLTSPNVKISLINTSLTLLPSLLVPVPMSSHIILDLFGSKITNLSPPFLSQNIKLEGLSPTCDCNAIHLVKYLKNVESNVMCAAPDRMKNQSVLDVGMDQLTCDTAVPSTTPLILTAPTIPSSLESENPQDVIWSLPPKSNNNKSLKKSQKTLESKKANVKAGGVLDTANMDTLIYGVIGGVVGLILLFIFIIICFVKITRRGSSAAKYENTMEPSYPPPAPSVHGSSKSVMSKPCTCPSVKSQPIYDQRPVPPTNFSTVRSNGHLSAVNGGNGGYPSVHGIYAVQGGQMGSYYNYNYNNSMRQQQIYGQHPQIPFYPQEEYERR